MLIEAGASCHSRAKEMVSERPPLSVHVSIFDVCGVRVVGVQEVGTVIACVCDGANTIKLALPYSAHPKLLFTNPLHLGVSLCLNHFQLCPLSYTTYGTVDKCFSHKRLLLASRRVASSVYLKRMNARHEFTESAIVVLETKDCCALRTKSRCDQNQDFRRELQCGNQCRLRGCSVIRDCHSMRRKS